MVDSGHNWCNPAWFTVGGWSRMGSRRGTLVAQYPSGRCPGLYIPGYTMLGACPGPPYRLRGPVHLSVHAQTTVRQMSTSDMRHMRTCGPVDRRCANTPSSGRGAPSPRPRWTPSWRGPGRSWTAVMRLREPLFDRQANRNAADVPVWPPWIPFMFPSAFRLVLPGWGLLAQAHHSPQCRTTAPPRLTEVRLSTVGQPRTVTPR